jgi:hypothetical protein
MLSVASRNGFSTELNTWRNSPPRENWRVCFGVRRSVANVQKYVLAATPGDGRPDLGNPLRQSPEEEDQQRCQHRA